MRRNLLLLFWGTFLLNFPAGLGLWNVIVTLCGIGVMVTALLGLLEENVQFKIALLPMVVIAVIEVVGFFPLALGTFAVVVVNAVNIIATCWLLYCMFTGCAALAEQEGLLELQEEIGRKRWNFIVLRAVTSGLGLVALVLQNGGVLIAMGLVSVVYVVWLLVFTWRVTNTVGQSYSA